MVDIKKLQAQINREAWQRYRAAHGDGTSPTTASTPASKEVATFIAACERKHGKASDSPRVETPSVDGPQTQQAKKLAAAIARAKAGNIAEANGVHKLAPYVFGG